MTDPISGRTIDHQDCLRRLASVETELHDQDERIIHIEDWQRGAEEAIARAAAVEAVRLVFDKIGVDVDDKKSLAEFRESLQFASMVHTAARAGIISIIVTVCGLISSALWFGLKEISHR